MTTLQLAEWLQTQPVREVYIPYVGVNDGYCPLEMSDISIMDGGYSDGGTEPTEHYVLFKSKYMKEAHEVSSK